VEKVDVPYATDFLESTLSYSTPASTQMEKYIWEEKYEF
jgi:meiotically up-regulated gene 157 (Mug157) protein